MVNNTLKHGETCSLSTWIQAQPGPSFHSKLSARQRQINSLRIAGFIRIPWKFPTLLASFNFCTRYRWIIEIWLCFIRFVRAFSLSDWIHGPLPLLSFSLSYYFRFMLPNNKSINFQSLLNIMRCVVMMYFLNKPGFRKIFKFLMNLRFFCPQIKPSHGTLKYTVSSHLLLLTDIK